MRDKWRQTEPYNSEKRGQGRLSYQFERLGLAVEHQSNITNNVDTKAD